MIDEKELAELRHDMELGWSDPVKLRYKDLKEYLDTLSAALKVVRAAQSVADQIYHDHDGLTGKHLDDCEKCEFIKALALFEEEK